MIFHLLFFVINSLFVPVRILSCDVLEDGKPHSERKKKKEAFSKRVRWEE